MSDLFNFDMSANITTTDTSLLEHLKSELQTEWKGDEPGINFFLLIASLLLFLFWATFSVYFFSRILGLIVSITLKRLLRYSMGDSAENLRHFSVGSFSVSLLAGKLMFRGIVYVTDDYTMKINDGWVIFSYWRMVPRKVDAERKRIKEGETPRLHISLNGVKVHIYNRLNVYERIAKMRQSATPPLFAVDPNSQKKKANAFAELRRRVDNEQLEEWWDKFWRLVGAITLDISACRLIAGNQRMPYAFAITFENFQSNLFIGPPSNPDDRYMFRCKATMENARIALVKQSGYSTSIRPREDPPRTMGDGFALLQSANIHVFYHQDILGLVKEGEQSLNTNIPIWETVWRLHKNTIISYGPWADKQRSLLYSFFFPSETDIVPITEMPKCGESRIFISHNSRVFFSHDASFDIWFMRNEELNAFHSRINHGSSFEFTIPWICSKNGYTSVTKGSLLFLELTTSLPFRDFISCESAHFNLTAHFPRECNAHQSWDFGLELHRITAYIVWDHKRFISDLIDEWSSDNTADLCHFVPYTWTFNVNIVDQFEVRLLLNDKNWIDTSTTEFAENTQTAIVGNQLTINFALPFVDFSPILQNIRYEIRAFGQLALRFRVPPQSPMEPIFSALHNSAAQSRSTKSSTAFISAIANEGFVELWRTDYILIQLDHMYHPVSTEIFSDLPEKCLLDWLPTKVAHPRLLDPDQLDIRIDIAESEIRLSGVVIRMIFDLVNNYFGGYDQISDANATPNGSVVVKMTAERPKPPEHFRPMNVNLRVQLQNLSAHCLLFSPKTDGETADLCPMIFNEQIAVELTKDHTETMVQVQIAPTAVFFSPQPNTQSFHGSPIHRHAEDAAGWLTLSGLQFRGHGLLSDEEVPWKIEYLEYAWLVEVILGDIRGNILPEHISVIGQFAESLALLSLFPDEAMKLPEKYNLCHHYEPARACTRPRPYDGPCLSLEKVKYKLIRVGIDNISVLILSDDFGVSLNSEDIRVSFCNAHSGSFAENLVVKIPFISLNQLVVNPSKKRTYLEAGSVTLNQIDFDIRLPSAPKDVFQMDERQSFLRKHDKSQKRLFFLWNQSNGCSCVGESHFFGAEDTTGRVFLRTPPQKLGIAEFAEIPKQQPKFLQSIIDRSKSGVQLTEFPKSPSTIRTHKRVKSASEPPKRTLSDSSFKSAASQVEADLSFLVENYADFLSLHFIPQKQPQRPLFSAPFSIETWVSENTVKVERLSDGIATLRLVHKEPTAPQRATTPLRQTAQFLPSDPFESQKRQFDSNFGKSPTALYARGRVAESVEIFVSPLALDTMGKMVTAVGNSLTSSHPATAPQRRYLLCTLRHHCQPLLSMAKNSEDFLINFGVYTFIELPTVNLTAFQSEPSIQAAAVLPKTPTFTDSALILQIHNSYFITQPDSSTLFPSNLRAENSIDRLSSIESMPSSRNVSPRPNQHIPPNRISFRLFCKSIHSHFLHFVDTDSYDENVYTKIPVQFATNWADISKNERTEKIRPRVLTDVSIPDIDAHFVLTNLKTHSTEVPNVPQSVRRSGSKESAVEKSGIRTHPLTHSFSAEIGMIHLTSLLGRPIDADSPMNEMSFHEVLAPTLNVWNIKGNRLADEFSKLSDDLALWSDVGLAKLMADALDWDDDQSLAEKISRLPSIRVYGRQYDSCPSCKLMLTLLHFVAKNAAAVQRDYFPQMMLAMEDLSDERTRKCAIIALLSHWQTVICTQIHLFDNQIAQHFKAEIPILGGNDPQSNVGTITENPNETNTKPNSLPRPPVTDSNQLLNNAEAFGAHGSVKLLPQTSRPDENLPLLDRTLRAASPRGNEEQRIDSSSRPSGIPRGAAQRIAQSGTAHQRQISSASASGFVPGHRRGPSTATQMTAEQSRPEDLYHWILRAQREHKQKYTRAPIEKDTTYEVNPMELVLDVFFWTLYEDLDLEKTPLDSVPLGPMNLTFILSFSGLKIDVIEKKLLKSASDQMFLSLNCHHLALIESFELKGTLIYDVETDELKIKPQRGDLFMEYTAKVENIRIVASLASIAFLNDLVISVHLCSKSFNELNTNGKRRRRITNQSIEERWTLGVLDKLYDYQRYVSRTSQSSGVLATNIAGAWSLKMVLLESMVADLFVSMTLVRIDTSHAHRHRTQNSTAKTPLLGTPKPSVSAVRSNSQPLTSEDKLTKDLSDSLSVEVKRANLIFSEHRSQRSTSETKQILNCSMRQSSVRFKIFARNHGDSPVTQRRHQLIVNLGEIEGDLPMHAQSIHELVLCHGPQLSEQFHRILDQNSRFLPDYRRTPNSANQSANRTESTLIIPASLVPVIIHFEIHVLSVELNAQLLPSLKTKYKLDRAQANGKAGGIPSEFAAEILDHQLCFLVIASHNTEMNAPPTDTFTLPLPYIKVSGRYRNDGIHQLGPNPKLVYKPGGYHDVIVAMGPMEHTFSTDLLNQILFAEQSFRSELTFLLERLSVERSPSLPASKPILFNLTFQGEGEPWLQLTAATPTATAVRFTIDGPTAVLTNRLMPLTANVHSTEPERLFGRAKVQLNVKLGQLCKSAMYAEATEELQEFATFMTQISAQNEEVSMGSLHNYIITLNRPILLVKSTAIDKAILLWLNYRNTYNYWREERSKMSAKFEPQTPIAPRGQPAQTSPIDMNMNLSLSIQGGLYVCMPLFSEEPEDNMAALLVSLQKSDISVCVKKELACHAKFEAFKITFVDNFDEHSLSNSWLQENTGDSIHSNFVFFPEGSYYFCSSANSPDQQSENAKWILSIQSDMKGMVIDVDHKIGKLMNLCVHTVSSFTFDEDPNEDSAYPASEASSSLIAAPQSLTNTPRVTEALIIEDKMGTFDEMNRLHGYESKIRWLERKMHEQSVRVTDLLNDGKSEFEVETARNKLRVYELARFKQFRRSMLEKLRPKRTVGTPRSAIPNSPSNTAVSRNELSVRESTSPQKTVTESVDLNIDVQINIETGHTILRANVPTKSSAVPPLTKRFSTKDLKSKANIAPMQSITRLQIPSLDAKCFYTSNDSLSESPSHIRATFGDPPPSSSKNKCFYLALELAKMLEQTLVTPALADFLEQVVEPLPESLFEPSAATTERRESVDEVPIVAIDTSRLPLDVFFHMTVYSSIIRFEGQEEQRSSSAADCLLVLPALSLMASTRKYDEQSLNVAGIYLSATLSNFELSIYSPHQQATSHDALSLKLDKLSLSLSRTKCPTIEDDPKTKVQLVIIANVGRADFNYDMRRLGELLSFPKPWYRKKLIQRVFFGEQSLVRKDSMSTTHSAPSFVRTPKSVAAKASTAIEVPQNRTEWAAEVNFSMQWSELNVNAQMSNTMGNTVWQVRNGIMRGHVKLDSLRQRDIAFGFKLNWSQLSAQGGAISGDISIRELLISARHVKLVEKAPESVARLEFGHIETRVEWMSRPVFIGLFANPRIVISDEWSYELSGGGKVQKALCAINVNGSWSDLQMIITKNTTSDLGKIASKLVAFFHEQLQSSRLVWGHEFDRRSEGSDTSDSTLRQSASRSSTPNFSPPSAIHSNNHFTDHWQNILDLVTDVQMSRNYLPLPTTKDGLTVIGGTINFDAHKISLACMNGEMNASTWALFHMREANLRIDSFSSYTFVSEMSPSTVGIRTDQTFVFRLGESQPGNECKASVCRVQHTRNFLMRHNAPIEMCLEAMIGDVLKQLNLYADSAESAASPPRFTHSVLELFQFPALDAKLQTLQQHAMGIESPNSISEQIADMDAVESEFVAIFADAVCVLTDFNAQVGFLPELLKSYMIDEKRSADDSRSPPSTSIPSASHDDDEPKKDKRNYVCLKWEVDPKIRFIDRFRWNPPVIDDILRKLQIFDHRTTIPKVMQRSLLDRCDVFIASLLEQLIRQALRE